MLGSYTFPWFSRSERTEPTTALSLRIPSPSSGILFSLVLRCPVYGNYLPLKSFLTLPLTVSTPTVGHFLTARQRLERPQVRCKIKY